MSKLFKLKEWVTLPEAVSFLSLTLAEKVSLTDLLRLVLDRHLMLSVYFFNSAPAKRGKKIPASEVLWKEVISLISEDEMIQVADCVQIVSDYYKDVINIKLEENIFYISGLYDIPLIGNDRIQIERIYLEQINGAEYDGIYFDGAFVELNGAIFQVQESFDDVFIKKMRESKDHTRNSEYFPSGRLPDDATLVLRTKVLNAFVESLANEKSQRQNKSADSRTQSTLLKMIITMAKEGYSYDPTEPKSKTPKEIVEDAQKIGLNISIDTVRKWLKESVELLDQAPE